MNGRPTMPRQAVVFASCAPGQGLLKGLELAPGYIPTASAYEAAAELLAGPVAAVVVDLRLLRPGHLRLIELARRAGAALLGVGPLPPWARSGQLDGLRLVGPGQLAQALRTPQERQPAPRPIPQADGLGGAYEAAGPAPKAPVAEGEPLLTTEELNALLGDVE